MVKAANSAGPKKGGRKKVMDERPEGQGRPVLYPKVQLIAYSGDGQGAVEVVNRPAITAQKMKEILAWESEPEYVARRQKDDPTFKGGLPDVGQQVSYTDAETGVEYKATVLLEDNEGHKVVCWNIVGNRDFKETIAKGYAQDILNRQWAGPTTFPGETFNGETFQVGRTGKVESGQHRGIGLVLAWQAWKKHCEVGGRWSVLWPKDKYPDGPVMDLPIFVGISEDPKVVRTLDNVRARTTADTIFTSPIFDGLKPEAKKECSRALGVAMALLWDRTGAGKLSSFHKYRTHAEEIDFLDRHPRLKKCVLHCHKCNSGEGKALSTMGVSAGEASALMYLMAHGNSDIDSYRNADPLPKESVLKMDLWDKAESFWKEIGEGTPTGAVISATVADVSDKDSGGIKAQKFAILAKAWALYVDDQVVVADAITLQAEEFQVDENGVVSLALSYTFNHDDGGIDLGSKVKKAEERSSETAQAIDEAQKQKAEERAKLVEEYEKKIAEAKRREKNGGQAPTPMPDSPSTKDFASYTPNGAVSLEPDAADSDDDFDPVEPEYQEPVGEAPPA